IGHSRSGHPGHAEIKPRDRRTSKCQRLHSILLRRPRAELRLRRRTQFPPEAERRRAARADRVCDREVKANRISERGCTGTTGGGEILLPSVRLYSSGEGGIRTLGRASPSPVFETGPIGHSGTSPARGGNDYTASRPRRLPV